jgi:hypothetical protein
MRLQTASRLLHSPRAGLLVPLWLAAAFAVACMVAALVLTVPLSAQTGYVRGLAGIAALAVIVPCAVQGLAFVDGAHRVGRAEGACSAWLRIAVEAVAGGLLTVLVTLPLAVAATPAGWLVALLPLADAYLLAVGFMVIQPRYRDVEP